MYEATTWIVGLIVWGLIWGAVSRQCVVNRGYEEEGGKYFALGFFFWYNRDNLGCVKTGCYNAAADNSRTNETKSYK